MTPNSCQLILVNPINKMLKKWFSFQTRVTRLIRKTIQAPANHLQSILLDLVNNKQVSFYNVKSGTRILGSIVETRPGRTPSKASVI